MGDLADTAALGRGLLVGGRFRLVAELGRGGSSVVWRAVDLQGGGEVALKLLPEEVSRDPGAAKRLAREAERLRALDHPAIARVITCGTDPEPPLGPLTYVAVELLGGPSLREHLAEAGALPLAEVVRILRPLAGALDHAHAHKLAHMDVKPANVLFSAPLDQGGEPKLIDFGIAHEIHETLSLTGEQLEAMLESDQALVGTPAYMSPEQHRGEKPRPATDVWSLGVVAYVMLADSLPFAGSPAVRRQRILEAPPEPFDLEHDDPGCLAAVQAALGRALAKDRSARFPSAMAFVEALEAAGARPLPRPRIPPRARPLIAPGGLAALVASAALTLFTLTQDPLGGPRDQDRWRVGPPPEVKLPGPVPEAARGNRTVYEIYLRAGRRAALREQLEDAARLFRMAAEEAAGIALTQLFRYRALLALADVRARQGQHEAAAGVVREAQALK